MGNFIELVKFRAENDDVLWTYLETSPRNAICTSKMIQNKMISVIGNAIEDIIINEIRTSHKVFHLTSRRNHWLLKFRAGIYCIVIRFVDRDKHIREEFLGFITVEYIKGEALATALLTWLETHNIDVSLCRGQGYDGASSMSSSTVGVQARIREVSPMAFYTHCQSHQLNPCVIKTCSLPQIRNASGVISECRALYSNEKITRAPCTNDKLESQRSWNQRTGDSVIHFWATGLTQSLWERESNDKEARKTTEPTFIHYLSKRVTKE